MSSQGSYQGGENFNLRDVLQQGRSLNLRDRTTLFGSLLDSVAQGGDSLYGREIQTAADRVVTVADKAAGRAVPMVMFGSNNYLGLANHPYVKTQVQRAVASYGVGVGGPPLLNGYTTLHRRLEERLAALKHAEDAMLFSTGYGANVGLVSGLVNPSDYVVYDEYSHASFCDGVKLAGVKAFRFRHNDVARLERMLERFAPGGSRDIFVGVEGVYSMDGDAAPLDQIVPLCHRHGALVLLDDAHGTGVMGATGTGTAEHFGVTGLVDVTMGTFSKAFGVVGGFVCASRPIIAYLRYFARSYMFSASLPPIVVAAVLAGLDVMEREPALRVALRANVARATRGLRKLGFEVNPAAAIIVLRVPEDMDIRRAAVRFHEAGIFVNSIEYPAVPLHEQRFRISMMATHTAADIDRLLEAVEEVWADRSLRETAGTLAA